jgi:hypothetical protein
MRFALIAALLALLSCDWRARAVAPPGPLPASAFRVKWESIETTSHIVPPGERVRVLVRFRNTGDRVWPDPQLADPAEASGKNAIRLGCRWLNANGRVHTDFDRVNLPFPLMPDQSIELATITTAPREPGVYRLQFDLVQEMVAWFGDRNNPRPSVTIRVPGAPR